MTQPDLPTDDRHPWERQPAEGHRAFEAFVLYRDMEPGERSQRKVAEALGKSGALVSRWSSTHRWVDRAASWDVEQDRKWRADMSRRRRRATERHLGIAQVAQQKITQRLLDIDPKKLTVAEATRLLEVAVRIERDALGEPTRHEVSGPGGDPLQVQLAEFTSMDSQRRRLVIAEMVSAVRRRVEAASGVSDDDDDRPGG